MSNQRLRILVAEDNLALAGVLRFNLERAGYEVSVANNGSDAWEFAQQEKYDLVITDQQMPGITGIDLSRNLRTLDHYAHVPLVLITAKGLELELPTLREELGLAGVFSKPFSPSQIVASAEHLLSQPC